MAETTFHFDTDVNFAGVPGALPLLGPFPRLGGSLFGAYMFGRSHARFARGANAEAYGPRFDWSGNGRHLSTLGAVSEFFTGDGLLASPDDDRPKTPFSADQILAVTGGCSVVTVAQSVDGAPAIAFARPGKNAPTFTAILYPTIDLYRTSITVNPGSVTTSAQIDAPATDVDELTTYGSVFGAATRSAYSKFGVNVTVEDSDSSGTLVSNNLPFDIGETGGAGSGDTLIHGMAFYDRVISKTEFETAHARFQAFLDAIDGS